MLNYTSGLLRARVPNDLFSRRSHISVHKLLYACDVTFGTSQPPPPSLHLMLWFVLEHLFLRKVLLCRLPFYQPFQFFPENSGRVLPKWICFKFNFKNDGGKDVHYAIFLYFVSFYVNFAYEVLETS